MAPRGGAETVAVPVKLCQLISHSVQEVLVSAAAARAGTTYSLHVPALSEGHLHHKKKLPAATLQPYQDEDVAMRRDTVLPAA